MLSESREDCGPLWGSGGGRSYGPLGAAGAEVTADTGAWETEPGLGAQSVRPAILSGNREERVVSGAPAGTSGLGALRYSLRSSLVAARQRLTGTLRTC